ncbi:MAG: DUF1624 domain-containing protein [Euryarchaeota archaeon]|jgi:uncharacterized membrane protein|nr:DUF1624 domain-containing protein [Euryarchaeota archaeon]MBT4981561.1 DUF1624 domain-containing protein [Euryarchaeota archaeon]
MPVLNHPVVGEKFSQRLGHIDSLRGLAVLLMIMVHAAATWNPFSNSEISTLAYVVSGLGGLAAPLFVTLLGWGLLQTESTRRKRISRATFLLAMQIVVNLFAPHLFAPFTPGVLSLFALLIISEPIWSSPFRSSKLLPQTVFSLLLFLTVIGLYFGSGFQGSDKWTDRTTTASIQTLILHLLLTGTYPLFPWMIFAVFGAFIAKITSIDSKINVLKLTTTSIVFGLIFCVTSLVWSIHNDSAWALPSGEAVLTFFPPNYPFILAALTGVLLLWALIYKMPQVSFLEDTGRCSLTLYVVHFIPFALFHKAETTYGWSLTISCLVVIGYTIAWIPIAKLWRSKFPSYTLEKLMRNLSEV